MAIEHFVEDIHTVMTKVRSQMFMRTMENNYLNKANLRDLKAATGL